MVESKILTIEELTTDNSTLCLSPNRVFNRCHMCEIFKNALRKNDNDIVKTIEKLKCFPHIDSNILILQDKKKELLKKLKEIDKKIRGE